MTTTAGARPALRLPALVAYVFRACLPPTRLFVLALPMAACLGAGLLSLVPDEPDAFARVADVLVFGLALPLGSLVVGDAVLGAEVRAGTLAFTWLTPTRFGELVLARWLGGWTVAVAALVPSAALAAVIAGEAGHAGALAVAVAAGTGAHVAMFVLIGALTRRAAVWSLAVVFLAERLLGAVLTGIAQLSPTWLGRAVYVDLADVPGDMARSGMPAGTGAIVRLAIVAAVCLLAATWGLRRLQLTGARD